METNEVIIVGINITDDLVITNDNILLSIIEYYDDQIIECPKEEATSCMFVDNEYFYVLDITNFRKRSN